MRLWVRLAFAMVVLAVVPVLLVGLSAMEIATRRAETASVERLRREAMLQAELIGQWVHDQAPLVVAFPQLYPDGLQNLSAEAQEKFPVMVYRLVASAVTVVLVDGDGVLVAAPVYGEDPAGSSDETRAQELVSRLPLGAAVAGGAVATDGEPEDALRERSVRGLEARLRSRVHGGPSPFRVPHRAALLWRGHLLP